MSGKLAYSILLKNGICATCGVRPLTPGKKRCEKCDNYLKTYYKRIIDKGLCFICRKKLEDTSQKRAKCDDCRKKQREYDTMYREIKRELKENGRST